MNNKIEKLYKEIKEYGVTMHGSEGEYVKKSLTQAYLAGRIEALEESLELQKRI